jgi:hypothetical protein
MTTNDTSRIGTEAGKAFSAAPCSAILASDEKTQPRKPTPGRSRCGLENRLYVALTDHGIQKVWAHTFRDAQSKLTRRGVRIIEVRRGTEDDVPLNDQAH